MSKVKEHFDPANIDHSIPPKETPREVWEQYVDAAEASKEADRIFREYQNDKLAAFVSGRGTKHDGNKPDLTLVNRQVVEAAARALMYGARKYGRDNYKLGIDENRIKAAILRHLFADLDGERLDPESGLEHLDHVAAGVAMWAYQRSRK